MLIPVPAAMPGLRHCEPLESRSVDEHAANHPEVSVGSTRAPRANARLDVLLYRVSRARIGCGNRLMFGAELLDVLLARQVDTVVTDPGARHSTFTRHQRAARVVASSKHPEICRLHACTRTNNVGGTCSHKRRPIRSRRHGQVGILRKLASA